MSELKVYVKPIKTNMFGKMIVGQSYYLKSEADKVIADLEESHKMEVEQLLIEIAELKNRIAPKQSDKTLQERLNEVCKKHGVSNLQDLDWAFCESENRHTKDCIEAVRLLCHSNYKRCLAMAKWCRESLRLMRTYEVTEDFWNLEPGQDAEYFCKKGDFYRTWRQRWLALAEEPTWTKFLQLIHKEEK